MDKIKLFTHTDLDGVGCAILGILAYGFGNIDIEYCGYENINEKVEEYITSKEFNKYQFCFITDISIDEDVARLIESETIDGDTLCNHIQVIDHHKTALWLNKYWWCQVIEHNIDGVRTSGTQLFYEWLIRICKFKSGTMGLSKFVTTVNDYDTWKWKADNNLFPKQMNDLLYIYGRESFIDRCIKQIRNYTCDFDYTDLLLLDMRQCDIDKYIESKNKNIFKTKFNQMNMGVVFADRFHSELGNTLCELNPDIDFVAIVDMDKSVSYRTIKDIDVSVIAKQFGGGGHPKASGSPMGEYVVPNTIKDILGVGSELW